MTDLTRDDLDVLIDAVKEWESKGSLGEFVGDVMTSLIGPREGPDREQWMRQKETERLVRKEKYDAEKRVREERSTLLRAKLITIRDRMDIDAFTASRG